MKNRLSELIMMDLKERNVKRFVEAEKPISNDKGYCPMCDNNNLTYDAIEIEENMAYYPWNCKDCGAQGEEWYSLKFAGHNINNEDGNFEVESLLQESTNKGYKEVKKSRKLAESYEDYANKGEYASVPYKMNDTQVSNIIKQYKKDFKIGSRVHIPGEGDGKVVAFDEKSGNYGQIVVQLDDNDDKTQVVRLGIDDIKPLKESVEGSNIALVHKENGIITEYLGHDYVPYKDITIIIKHTLKDNGEYDEAITGYYYGEPEISATLDMKDHGVGPSDVEFPGVYTLDGHKISESTEIQEY